MSSVGYEHEEELNEILGIGYHTLYDVYHQNIIVAGRKPQTAKAVYLEQQCLKTQNSRSNNGLPKPTPLRKRRENWVMRRKRSLASINTSRKLLRVSKLMHTWEVRRQGLSAHITRKVLHNRQLLSKSCPLGMRWW